MYYTDSVNEKSKPSRNPDDYWQAGFDPSADTDELYLSGLRGRRLCIVLSCLGVLWCLALTTLLCNVILLTFLRMGHRGMDSMQFHRVDKTNDPSGEEHIVEFTSKQVELDEVVSNNGSMGGYKEEELYVQGSRVVLSTNSMNTSLPDGTKIQLVLEDGRIRLEGLKDFVAIAPNSEGSLIGQTMFSAKNPKFRMDEAIKQLTTHQIMTNNVRSPVDKSLRFDVENLSFRGNEYNKFNSKTLHVQAENNINFVVNNNGRLHLSGGKSVAFGSLDQFALSSTPSRSADLLGKRLCACIQTHRLFTVPGNKPCNIDPGYCY